MTEYSKENNLHELLLTNPGKAVRLLISESWAYGSGAIAASTRRRVGSELLVHVAALNSSIEILKEVIHYGRPSDVNAAIKTNDRFIRPLHFAVASGDIEKVKFLIDEGADTRLTRDLRSYTDNAAMKAYLKSEEYKTLVQSKQEEATRIRSESLKDEHAIPDPKNNNKSYNGLKMILGTKASVQGEDYSRKRERSDSMGSNFSSSSSLVLEGASTDGEIASVTSSFASSNSQIRREMSWVERVELSQLEVEKPRSGTKSGALRHGKIDSYFSVKAKENIVDPENKENTQGSNTDSDVIFISATENTQKSNENEAVTFVSANGSPRFVDYALGKRPNIEVLSL